MEELRYGSDDILMDYSYRMIWGYGLENIFKPLLSYIYKWSYIILHKYTIHSYFLRLLI